MIHEPHRHYNAGACPTQNGKTPEAVAFAMSKFDVGKMLKEVAAARAANRDGQAVALGYDPSLRGAPAADLSRYLSHGGGGSINSNGGAGPGVRPLAPESVYGARSVSDGGAGPAVAAPAPPRPATLYNGRLPEPKEPTLYPDMPGMPKFY